MRGIILHCMGMTPTGGSYGNRHRTARIHSHAWRRDDRVAARGAGAGGWASCRPLGIVGPSKCPSVQERNGGLRSCGANYLRTAIEAARRSRRLPFAAATAGSRCALPFPTSVRANANASFSRAGRTQRNVQKSRLPARHSPLIKLVYIGDLHLCSTVRRDRQVLCGNSMNL